MFIFGFARRSTAYAPIYEHVTLDLCFVPYAKTETKRNETVIYSTVHGTGSASHVVSLPLLLLCVG